jgi:hypothetical protein
MNVEIGAEAAQFPEKEYINGNAVAVQLSTAGYHGSENQLSKHLSSNQQTNCFQNSSTVYE